MQSSHHPPLHPVAAVDLRGSRTSSSWSTLPGNWDRLNLRAVYPSDNDLGIPSLPAATPPSEQPVPSALIPYTQRHRLVSPALGDCVHFFLDDYRFEVVWSQPEKCLSRVSRAGMALTPDFSLYPEMPKVVQMWNVYRSRWCGAWMAAHGITVIPTVSWSDESSYAYAFLGLPRGGTVAVSTVGIARASATEQGLFHAGLEQLVSLVAPSRLLIYGSAVPGLPDADSSIDLVFFPARRNR